MSYLFSDLKVDLQRKIHGKSLVKISGPEELAYEAARNVLLMIDPHETRRVAYVENGLYEDIYRYVTPADIKGDKIIDIRPQTDRGYSDKFSHVFEKEFDMNRNDFSYDVVMESGVKYLTASRGVGYRYVLNTLNSITGNGAWSVTNGTGLIADTLTKFQGQSSLRFTSSATGSYIENSTMTSVDISNIKNIGALFVPIFIPSGATITSLSLRWGSSSSNYYTQTATSAHDATTFKQGWNIVRFDWAGATPTGTPVDTAINYLRLTLNYTGTPLSSFYVDQITANLARLYEIVYYSKYLFRSIAGVWKEKPTADDDIINLDTESYNLLLYETVFLAAQEIQGEDSSFDVAFFEKQRDRVFKEYKAQHKSEVIKQSQQYYSMPGKRKSMNYFPRDKRP